MLSRATKLSPPSAKDKRRRSRGALTIRESNVRFAPFWVKTPSFVSSAKGKTRPSRVALTTLRIEKSVPELAVQV